jgi:hypothetical protein
MIHFAFLSLAEVWQLEAMVPATVSVRCQNCSGRRRKKKKRVDPHAVCAMMYQRDTSSSGLPSHT